MSINSNDTTILARRIKAKALLQGDETLQNEAIIMHLLNAQDTDISREISSAKSLMQALVDTKDKASLSRG